MAQRPTLSRRHVMLLATAAFPAMRARAQSTPTTEADPVTRSWEVTTGEMPPVAQITFSRLVIEPDARVPSHPAPGPSVVFVLQGEILLDADGSVSLRAGEGTLTEAVTTITLENASESPAEVLWLQALPAEAVGTPAASATAMSASSGVETRIIGAARADFASERAIMIVEQDVQPAGSSSVSSTHNGVELGEVHSGSASVLFLRGDNHVMPANAQDETTDVEANSRVDLGACDRYASVDGSLVWRAGREEPLVVLRALVIPIPQPS